MLKQANPGWGCQRISDMLLRGPALPASAGALARVLVEAGYELKEEATRPHADNVRHFERARPNQLWQTLHAQGLSETPGRLRELPLALVHLGQQIPRLGIPRFALQDLAANLFGLAVLPSLVM